MAIITNMITFTVFSIDIVINMLFVINMLINTPLPVTKWLSLPFRWAVSVPWTESKFWVPVVPQDAVPEVSKRQKEKHIKPEEKKPIEIDCALLNTSHWVSHATLFCSWLEQGSLEQAHCCLTTKYYSVLSTKYYKILLRTTESYSVLWSTTLYYKVLHSITQYYKVLQSTTQYYKVL